MTASTGALRARALRAAAAAVVALTLAAPTIAAQQRDSASTAVSRRRPTAARDSAIKPPISPSRAFFTSLLVPGLAQRQLGRNKVGAIFVGAELSALGMAIKAKRDIRIARRHAGDTAVVAIQPEPGRGTTVIDSAGRPYVPTCPKGTNGPLLGPIDTLSNSAPIICPSRYTAERIRARRTHYEDWIAVIIFNHLFAGADGFVAAQLWELPTRVSVRPDGRGVVVAASVAW